MMERNLDRRVEALAPVTDPDLQFRMDEILDVVFADDVLAWELGPDREWRRVHGDDGHRHPCRPPGTRPRPQQRSL